MHYFFIVKTENVNDNVLEGDRVGPGIVPVGMLAVPGRQLQVVG
jgi:hypothetical protein